MDDWGYRYDSGKPHIASLAKTYTIKLLSRKVYSETPRSFKVSGSVVGQFIGQFRDGRGMNWHTNPQFYNVFQGSMGIPSVYGVFLWSIPGIPPI